MKIFYVFFLSLFLFQPMTYASLEEPMPISKNRRVCPVEKQKNKLTKRQKKHRAEKFKQRQVANNKISKKKARASIIGGGIIFLIGVAALVLFLWFLLSGLSASLILLIGAVMALGTGGVLIVMGIINYKKAQAYEEEKIKLG